MIGTGNSAIQKERDVYIIITARSAHGLASLINNTREMKGSYERGKRYRLFVNIYHPLASKKNKTTNMQAIEGFRHISFGEKLVIRICFSICSNKNIG